MLGMWESDASPLLSFPPNFIVFYRVKQVPQHLSATLQREAASFPAPWDRGRPSVAHWAFGTRAPSQGAMRDPWEMQDAGGWEGGRSRRRRVSPPAPLPGLPSVRQIPAGWAHVRVLSPG